MRTLALRLCATKDCDRPAEKRRLVCRCCRARAERDRNPLEESYRYLKSNAKRRGKEFTLSLEFYRRLAIETEYITRRGRTATSYHIDRIDASRGYTEDNVQVLPAYINVRKDNPRYAPKLMTYATGAWCPETQQMVFWRGSNWTAFEQALGITHPDYVCPPESRGALPPDNSPPPF